MIRHLARFLKDESAATAIEYGLIAACVALAIITSVKGVSNNLKLTFNNVSTNLRQGPPGFSLSG